MLLLRICDVIGDRLFFFLYFARHTQQEMEHIKTDSKPALKKSKAAGTPPAELVLKPFAIDVWHTMGNDDYIQIEQEGQRPLFIKMTTGIWAQLKNAVNYFDGHF
jgi:hypothetical protein